MKIFPLLFGLVLFLTFAVSAQTNQNASCPKIDVSGVGLTPLSVPMTIMVSIEGYDLSKLSFRWTTSAGVISEGQGTTSIRISNYKMGENVTATVEVTGLPEGCNNTASETGSVICSCPSPTLSDEFSIPVSQIDKARLADFINELKKNPNAQGYIIEYFKPKTPQKIVNQKFRKIADYLVNELQFEKERITIITNFDKPEYLTKFWIVPPGAEPPTP
jgi:hypothetical protein